MTPHIITYHHTKKSKKIGKVLSVTRINGDLVILWRKTKRQSDAIKSILWFTVVLCLGFLIIQNWM